MKDLRNVIAQNIYNLRVGAQMTQSHLAALLNYTDKAISKWERGESIPDVTVLYEISRLFGVSVDYLLSDEHGDEASNRAGRGEYRYTLAVSWLSVIGVWILATVIFVALLWADISPANSSLTFIYAIPVSSILALIFNCIWGRRSYNFLFGSLILWSVIMSVYLSVLFIASANVWFVFLIGVPTQLAFLFIPGLSPKRRRDL